MVGRVVSGWAAIPPIFAGLSRDYLISRGRVLGLAIAPDQSPSPPVSPFIIESLGEPGMCSGVPKVLDLSALWAGPLAGALLQGAGGQVLKVESSRRLDGARAGDARFFALLHEGKEQAVLDFQDLNDRERLRALIRDADIIIEASRPRALESLGVNARAEASRGATWLSITGYGREGDEANAIAFGDDAAVAGGLTSHIQAVWGEAVFGGDAIADPLTGIFAALCGWASWLAGGGRLISLPMADIIAFGCRWGAADQAEARDWQKVAEADKAPLYAMRKTAGPPL